MTIIISETREVEIFNAYGEFSILLRDTRDGWGVACNDITDTPEGRHIALCYQQLVASCKKLS